MVLTLFFSFSLRFINYDGFLSLNKTLFTFVGPLAAHGVGTSHYSNAEIGHVAENVLFVYMRKGER